MTTVRRNAVRKQPCVDVYSWKTQKKTHALHRVKRCH